MRERRSSIQFSTPANGNPVSNFQTFSCRRPQSPAGSMGGATCLLWVTDKERGLDVRIQKLSARLKHGFAFVPEA